MGRRGGDWNRHWDRRRDHYWRGHRCRWVNNSWVIFATAFYPYGYGYYPYGAYYPYADYSYYDEGSYADTEAPDPYAKSSDYDEGAADSNVSQIQSALSREGYYSGAIDGNLGPETRNALRRYQRDRGLSVTGRVDRATINALGLR
ncbi:MAG TPA: peptidoglycan-binding domain-containing protein [Chthoniobacterales bacterium]